MLNQLNKLNREERKPIRRAQSDAPHRQKETFRFRKELFQPLNTRGVAARAKSLPSPALFRFHFWREVAGWDDEQIAEAA